MRIIQHRVHDLHSISKIQNCKDIHGIECDIRYRNGKPYFNHDIDASCSGIELHQALKYLRDKLIILNIKETGNEMELINSCLIKGAIPLILDAPMPAIKKLYENNLGTSVMWRVSEYESLNPQTFKSFPPSWIWLDSFHSFWFDSSDLDRTYWGTSSICLVSPELQGRESSPDSFTSEFLQKNCISAVCTKFPELYLPTH